MMTPVSFGRFAFGYSVGMMGSEISPEAMQAYVRTARARARARKQRLESRRARAWDLVRRAATVLKADFGASQVKLFGSLLNPRRFHERSDVDLAVWGLDERLYYRAVSRLLSLDPAIEIDLVEAELARPEFLATIEREGSVL